ncbi:hypothetical protein FRC17_009478 [Serendipita sp. 399]|nr:hypothetical protein FRC17_009478 [Serendipita sp. 399]
MPVSSREPTRDVWNHNLEEAMRDLRRLVDAFPYVAIDCEFPAVVARPIGKFKTSTDYHYQTMRCNVDILKLIQLGIALVNDEGKVAQDCTWQFNFYFNTDEDTYEPNSIDALSKAGLDFARHRSQGIQPADFAELMITSGLVLSDEATWISYHGAYDFGYLLRMLTGAPLPVMEEEFFDIMKIWFPSLYDIKYIMRQIKPSLKGGLQEIAQDLGVANVAPANATFTSGYAAHLAAITFHKIIDHYIQPTTTRWDISGFQGALYGLGSTYVSGALDNSRSTLTSAERERPGAANHTNNANAAGVHTSALSSIAGGSSLGVLSPGQTVMGHQTAQQQQQHLGALGASATHYAIAAAAAAAGGHGVGVGGMGVLPLHHQHGLHHHQAHHHHPHGASNLSGMGLGGAGSGLAGLGHHLGAAGGHQGGAGGAGAGAGGGAGGAGGVVGQGNQGNQGQAGQGGQGVYGMVPGVNSYVPGYGLSGMGVGMPGYGGVPNMGHFYARDR